ncbi:F510_1955 family glycosylhydrolase [Blastococcus sp. CCUG 61487]|uniref:F510_1955 family glycosylhydrolase n=1 Tax=Blastococcus sp. CCUG 61487 TaxID=1840703 RepID=UPI00201DBFCF|nr:exo-alpha-sialidase [Blastococcus sp. CCUG 61487]
MPTTRPARTAHAHRALAGAVLLTLLTGCAATDGPAATGPATSGAAGALPAAHVHAVAVDPGDGALLLATHEGLVEVDDDGRLSPVGPVIDLMGFAVAGPDHYLASGHPGLRTDLPNPVGLIESTDGGVTWTPLSRAGESDFHALTALPGGGAIGYDGALRRTADGSTWEQLAVPAEPHTLTAAPDGAGVLATTAAGLMHSADAGTTWASVDGAPLLQVVTWSEDGSAAVGITPDGAVWTSTDPARSWQPQGQLDAAPHAVAATTTNGRLRVVAVTDDGLLESTDGGVSFTTLLST